MLSKKELVAKLLAKARQTKKLANLNNKVKHKLAAPITYAAPSITLVMTTAPRPVGEHPLNATLSNIHAVGFRQPVNLFSEKEPPSIADDQRCRYVVHHYSGKDVGNFRNWRRAAMWAYTNTDTKWYLFMEDDIEWCTNGYKQLKSKLNGIDAGSAKTSRDSLGMLSFYTSPAMVPPNAVSDGWYDARYYGAIEGFWGALAMCMTRESLGALLQHARFKEHESTYQTDYVIGEIFRNLMEPKLAVRIHVPSLVEHTGEYSTIFSDADIKAGGVDVLRHGYKFNRNY